MGSPTCIGISWKKSLTKLTNHIYETAERKLGSYPGETTQAAALCPHRAWMMFRRPRKSAMCGGVGRRICKQIKEHGIQTVLDPAGMHPAIIRRGWGA